MVDINKRKINDFFALLLTVIATIIICNWATPSLYKYFGGTHRTSIILDKLNDTSFSPDLVVFGSSKAMMGIDGYQMSKELGVDVYNFSSTGQPPVESSLYYGLLPQSVKTVVQIIYAPIKEKKVDSKEKKLSKNISIYFSMSGYELPEDIKRLNSNIDLSDLEKPCFLQNLDARGAIFVPGLTDLLLPQDKDAAVDLKFCNSYLTKRHQMYDRTINQLIGSSNIGKDIEIDSEATAVLNNYAKYLKEKGIKMIAVLMPSNPDVKEFSDDQMKMIGKKCKEMMPEAIVLNYLSLIKDTQLFFDAAHLNRDGARVVTKRLDDDIKRFGLYFK